jgi:hypothetical protein
VSGLHGKFRTTSISELLTALAAGIRPSRVAARVVTDDELQFGRLIPTRALDHRDILPAGSNGSQPCDMIGQALENYHAILRSDHARKLLGLETKLPANVEDQAVCGRHKTPEILQYPHSEFADGKGLPARIGPPPPMPCEEDSEAEAGVEQAVGWKEQRVAETDEGAFHTQALGLVFFALTTIAAQRR